MPRLILAFCAILNGCAHAPPAAVQRPEAAVERPEGRVAVFVEGMSLDGKAVGTNFREAVERALVRLGVPVQTGSGRGKKGLADALRAAKNGDTRVRFAVTGAALATTHKGTMLRKVVMVQSRTMVSFSDVNSGFLIGSAEKRMTTPSLRGKIPELDRAARALADHVAIEMASVWYPAVGKPLPDAVAAHQREKKEREAATTKRKAAKAELSKQLEGLLERCSEADNAACFKAVELKRGTPGTRYPRAAEEAFGAACLADSAAGCLGFADTTRYPKVAAKSLSMACAKGLEAGCVGFAKAQFKGRGVDRDPAAARATLATVCTQDNAEACAALAMIEKRGTDRPANLKRAAQLARKSCKLGIKRMCRRALEWAQDGED
jgi:TPR repeat protein